MNKKIIESYKRELSYKKILFKNSNSTLKLLNGSILIYLLIVFSFGLTVLSNSWILVIVSLPFILDLISYLLFKWGYLAFVEKKRYKALRANIEEYIGNYSCDTVTALSRYRKKKLKELVNERGWANNYESIIKALIEEKNSEFKSTSLVAGGIILVIASKLNLVIKLFIKTEEYFVFLGEMVTNKIPEDLVPTFIITTFLYLLATIIIAVVPFVCIRLYINFKFKIIRELIRLFQELDLENKK